MFMMFFQYVICCHTSTLISLRVSVKFGNRSECRLRDHRLAGRPKHQKAEMQGRPKNLSAECTLNPKIHQGRIYTKAEYTPRPNIHQGRMYTKAEFPEYKGLSPFRSSNLPKIQMQMDILCSQVGDRFSELSNYVMKMALY